MKASLRKRCQGFTLMEMVIALAVGLVLLGAAFGIFSIQSRSVSGQEQITEMQQNARSAMDMMSKEIKVGGYSPGTCTDAGITEASAGTLRIKMDLDGNGNTTGANEDVTYAYNAENLQITRNAGGGAQPIAENIQALNFAYYDGSGAVTAVLANIRKIQMAITAQTEKADTDYSLNNGHRTYTLTAIIYPVNLSLSGCTGTTTTSATTAASTSATTTAATTSTTTTTASPSTTTTVATTSTSTTASTSSTTTTAATTSTTTTVGGGGGGMSTTTTVAGPPITNTTQNPASATIANNTNVQVCATITGAASATLSTNFGDITMSFSGGQWCGTIPKHNNRDVSYHVSASDGAEPEPHFSSSAENFYHQGN